MRNPQTRPTASAARVAATIELPDDFQPGSNGDLRSSGPADNVSWRNRSKGPSRLRSSTCTWDPKSGSPGRSSWCSRMRRPTMRCSSRPARTIPARSCTRRTASATCWACARFMRTIPARPPGRPPNFPLPAGTLPGTLNQAPPAQHWIGAQPRTSGNNVVCRGEALGVVSGDLDGDVVTFGPFQADSDEDHVAHTFYFCNVMHDFFEALGFDEAVGQFSAGQPQRRARGRGSRAGDRLRRGSPGHRVDGHATRRSIAHDAHGSRRRTRIGTPRSIPRWCSTNSCTASPTGWSAGGSTRPRWDSHKAAGWARAGVTTSR